MWSTEQFCILLYLFLSKFCSATIEELRTTLTKVGDCTSAADRGYILTVNFEATLEDGTVLASTYDTGQPFEFVVGSADIQDTWNSEMDEACLGDSRRIEVPKSLLSQDKLPTVPPNVDVIFVVDVIQVVAPTTTIGKTTSQVKMSAITSQPSMASSSKLLTTLVAGSSLTPSIAKLGVKVNSITKQKPKSLPSSDQKVTLSSSSTSGLTRRSAVEIRILKPDESPDSNGDNITPDVLRSPPVIATERKITTRSVDENGSIAGADSPKSPPTGEPTPESDAAESDSEYVTDYYMQEVTVTLVPDDESVDDSKDQSGSGSKGKGKGGSDPKVSKKSNGKIYYHMQYIAVPVAIILFILVAYCLYTVEFPDRKVKFYRVRDHDPVLDGPL